RETYVRSGSTFRTGFGQNVVAQTGPNLMNPGSIRSPTDVPRYVFASSRRACVERRRRIEDTRFPARTEEWAPERMAARVAGRRARRMTRMWPNSPVGACVDIR